MFLQTRCSCRCDVLADAMFLQMWYSCWCDELREQQKIDIECFENKIIRYHFNQLSIRNYDDYTFCSFTAKTRWFRYIWFLLHVCRFFFMTHCLLWYSEYNTYPVLLHPFTDYECCDICYKVFAIPCIILIAYQLLSYRPSIYVSMPYDNW